MGQWVSLGLARRHGIATLLDTPLPGSWLAALHQRLLPDQRLDAGYERSALTWRIFDHLMQNETGAVPSALDRYLATTPGSWRVFVSRKAWPDASTRRWCSGPTGCWPGKRAMTARGRPISGGG